MVWQVRSPYPFRALARPKYPLISTDHPLLIRDWEQTGPAGPTAFWKFRYTIGEPDEPTADTAEIIPDDENDGDFEIPTDDDDEEEQDESDTEFESMRDEIMQTYAEQIAEAMERRVDVGGGAGVGGGSGGGSSSWVSGKDEGLKTSIQKFLLYTWI